MFPEFLQPLFVLLSEHPYVFIFVGLLFAGELVLLPSIYLAVTGRLQLEYVFAVAVIAMALSDLVWYYLGRSVPRERLERFGGGRIGRAMGRIERLYVNRGPQILIGSKFVYGTRTAAQVLSGVHHMRLRTYLIANSIGVALLVGAGLLTKSFYALQAEGAGIDAEGVLTARVNLPATRYETDDAEAAFFERALEALNALPGLTEVGFTSVLPFAGNNDQGSFVIDGYTAPDDVASPHSQQRSIDERYFDTLGIPVIQGRNFSARETDRVVIIDENLANRYWPDGDALGQRISRTQDADGNPIWFTVVGVVPAIKHASLAETPTKETTYWHHLQRPIGAGVFTLKTALPPESVAPIVTSTILAVDPELPVFDIMTMDRRLLESLGPQRTSMVLTLVFAGVAFVLAVIGIYGVLTWALTQRIGEIGVRMALGARARDIVRMVVRQGGRLTGIGLVVGVVGAVVLARLMTTQIHHVSALDPAVFAVVVGGLALAAVFASWIPARRASRIDPMQALRDE